MLHVDRFRFAVCLNNYGFKSIKNRKVFKLWIQDTRFKLMMSLVKTVLKIEEYIQK